ncbi:hypothetical protein ACUVHH_16705 [Vibrio parahaemolyticus]|uniref:hypothetical protein n=1 Tax=Vibrio parahaemolyticus TaxID=670 RepID=UPI0034E1AE14
MLITEALASVVCKYKFEEFIANDGYLEFFVSMRKRFNENPNFVLRVHYDHGLKNGSYYIKEFDSVCKQILGLNFGKRSPYRRTEAKGRFVGDKELRFDKDEKNYYSVKVSMTHEGDLKYGDFYGTIDDENHLCDLSIDDLKLSKRMRANLCVSDNRVFLKSVKMKTPDLNRLEQQIVIKSGSFDIEIDGREQLHSFKADIEVTNEIIKTFFSSILSQEKHVCETDLNIDIEMDVNDLIPSDYSVYAGIHKEAGILMTLILTDGIYEYHKYYPREWYQNQMRLKGLLKAEPQGLDMFIQDESKSVDEKNLKQKLHQDRINSVKSTCESYGITPHELGEALGFKVEDIEETPAA